MFASSVIHPIDLSKVRLQLFATLNPGIPKPSALTMIGQIAKQDGIKALYSGLSASIMRQAVYGTARIGLHRAISTELQNRNDNKPLPFYMKTLAGVVSGMIAVSLGTPFDVSLVRMQADSMKPIDSRRNYKHVFDAIARILREEGPGKLYSGLVPNIMRGVAVNVGMLACYDQAKEVIAEHITKEDPNGTPSLQTQMTASCVAGFTAASFSLPFDLLKSRLRKLFTVD
jgi:solute carrier family 25 oxoglutarate transporter 11